MNSDHMTPRSTYADGVDVGLVAEEHLLALVVSHVPQLAGPVHGARHVRVLVWGETHGADVPRVRLVKLHCLHPLLQVPDAAGGKIIG